MGTIRSYTASEDIKSRLDVALVDLGFYESRNQANKALASEKVFVNGEVKKKNYMLHAGDYLVYEEFDKETNTKLSPEDIPLNIVYEDDYLLVISKQAGLICHPSEDHKSHTLVNALLYHCGEENLCNVQGEYDRLGIVHRLDADTSGLMLVAKTDEVGQSLMSAIKDKNVVRRYKSLVHGIITQNTGLIDAPVARDAKDRKKMSVRQCVSSRNALTNIKVLARYNAQDFDNGYSFVECQLFTGRTHQIRVHMQYIHHPVVGDPLYITHAPKKPSASLGLSRQFLHSSFLSFEHPVTHETLTFEDDLPIDLCEALEKLQGREM